MFAGAAANRFATIGSSRWPAVRGVANGSDGRWQVGRLSHPPSSTVRSDWFYWGDAAKHFEQAQKYSSLLQVFVSTVLGETWTMLGEVPDWKALYDRREDLKTASSLVMRCFLRLARTFRRIALKSRSLPGDAARNRGQSITGCSKGDASRPVLGLKV